MAVMTMRMKYVWFPFMAVMAAHSLCVLDRFIGRFPKYAVAAALTVALLNEQYNVYLSQVANEQEFYDPDTVELMEWIDSLPEDASFTGSMQLLAGVKCCTGRPITNHPHFEDKWLRERTQRLYAIYGRKTASEVHEMLKREQSQFIILEDSICLAPSTGCSTNDIVDVSNRHPIDSAPDGRQSKTPRFCDEIRKMTPAMQKYFALVFANRTFRVYEVL
ncbi:dpy-19-like protein 3 [Aphelenchoides avenae]|nr:dpy-19-like protein 3 [Aphelenchus avenae]